MQTENYKTLLKEFKDLNKCKDILRSWIRRLNIAKTSISSKTIYRFNVLPIKTLMVFFYRNRIIHPKIQMESQGILKSHKNLEKEDERWRPVSDFKTYFCSSHKWPEVTSENGSLFT